MFFVYPSWHSLESVRFFWLCRNVHEYSPIVPLKTRDDLNAPFAANTQHKGKTPLSSPLQQFSINIEAPKPTRVPPIALIVTGKQKGVHCCFSIFIRALLPILSAFYSTFFSFCCVSSNVPAGRSPTSSSLPQSPQLPPPFPPNRSKVSINVSTVVIRALFLFYPHFTHFLFPFFSMIFF
jgi:hypothetical protein